jgi:hypothetical protein
MRLDFSDEDIDLLIRALEHYYAYSVARKSEDARYKELAERLKRKPAERVAQPERRSRRNA